MASSTVSHNSHALLHCDVDIAAHYSRQVKTTGAAEPLWLLRILVAERLTVFIIGEQFAVAAEIDDRPQGPLGVVLRHVILELLAEPGGGRPMARALIENALDVGSERDVRQHLVAECFLALVDVHIDKAPAEGSELEVALLELGETQQLQGLAEREKVVDFELERVREVRQIGPAVIGRR